MAFQNPLIRGLQVKSRSRFALYALGFLVSWSSLQGCKKDEKSGDLTSYVENGVTWAFGSVQLVEAEGPANVVLKKTTGAQAMAAAVMSLLEDEGSHPPYVLYGSLAAATGGSGQRRLAYVDQAQDSDKLLAFAYELELVDRQVPWKDFGSSQSPRQMDLYALLKRPGRSFNGHQRVFLGYARFQQDGSVGSVQLAPDLRVSLIASGVNAGQWALHYPNVNQAATSPWEKVCPQGIYQASGQNLSQNQNQYDFCRPLPPVVDLCDGDPTNDNCRPEIPLFSRYRNEPVSTPASIQPELQVTGLVKVPNNENVFKMSTYATEAKVVFVSHKFSATAEQNNQLCSKKFFAVARTLDGQVNSACVLSPAPAEAVGGRLACGVMIQLNKAQSFKEKVCNINVMFRFDENEHQVIQVLKR